MQTIEKLAIIEAVKALKARYCRLVDTKEWAAFEELFAPDATFETPASKGVAVRGGAQIVGLIRQAIGDAASLHLAYLPELEVIDAHNVRGVWGLETVLDARAAPGATPPRSYAFSFDSYVLSNGKWLVQSVRLAPVASR